MPPWVDRPGARTSAINHRFYTLLLELSRNSERARPVASTHRVKCSVHLPRHLHELSDRASQLDRECIRLERRRLRDRLLGARGSDGRAKGQVAASVEPKEDDNESWVPRCFGATGERRREGKEPRQQYIGCEQSACVIPRRER